jgi:hypothetical protein
MIDVNYDEVTDFSYDSSQVSEFDDLGKCKKTSIA